MLFSAETHPGAKLEENEDAVGWLTSHRVWLVADGMGGHACGELASRIVKETTLKRIAAGDADLAAVILQAHEAVLDAARADARRKDMGSTVVIARMAGPNCELAWCGDSRAYLWRAGKLTRLTKDHSLIEELIDSGQLRRENARQDVRQNVLKQAIGVNSPVPEQKSVPFETGDWILLCSDGLHDALSDQSIADILLASETPNDATRRLIKAAVAAEAEDNVSVIVVQPE